MKIQYINKENHTVYDDKEYVFKENKIKEVPDKLGNFLCTKYRNSFIKLNFIEVPKPEIKFKKQEIIKVTVYKKKANEQKFKKLPSSKDVKYKNF
jgi:hypothetical protein